ncbi:hypothetical protein L6452_37363 [Arctium lappa]|uniref:Uncharacterized protein n=1 Tax=Arctium lappa TaxID=4217 RepID=A0ACB8Y2R2_ARCLA|nr:hypothetical protein L6452_37363 [Arctium lappa]
MSHPRRPSRPLQRLEDEVQRRAEMISNLESLRLKIPPQTSNEEFDFLSKAEIEESVRAEKLIAECQKDADLALEVHSSLFNDDNMKKNPVKVQVALLKEIEEENAKRKEINDDSLAWCKKNLDHRSDPLKITIVTISGRKKKDRTTITMEIFREDGSAKDMFLSRLEHFGYSEWLEFREVLKKTRTQR